MSSSSLASNAAGLFAASYPLTALQQGMLVHHLRNPGSGVDVEQLVCTLPEAVDVRLIYRDRVLCAGGDHRHALRLDPRDLVRMSEPRVGDLCEHDPSPHRKDFGELPKV